MKILINRDLLFFNLNNISRALSTKPPMPVLTGIKIEARGNAVYLTASNNEISIQTVIKDKKRLQIEEDGIVVVPGKYFIEIVKKIEAKEIDISTFENNVVKIVADRSLFSLNAYDKDDYPIISFNDSDVAITMDVLNLKQLIKKTTFAASLSESRVILTGISFATEGPKMEVVATDSYRLAKNSWCSKKNIPALEPLYRAAA